MKPKGRHPQKRLTAVKARALIKPGRYADGNGLYLVVDPSGAKRWVLRFKFKNSAKRTDMGLGGLSLVSLAEARELATTYRKVAREGGNPIDARNAAAKNAPTFKEAAIKVHAANASTWRNVKHRAQWLSTLETYVFPEIGERRVDQIGTPDVLKVLDTIWLTKPETARRVRQRIGIVLDWAKARGYRSGENPILGVLEGLPKQKSQVAHHAALPYQQIPQFVSDLRASNAGDVVKLAFEFLVLTAARTNEVIGAEPGEIDQDGALWVVPAARMKADRKHTVPLSARCMEIVAEARDLAGDESRYLFPGAHPGKPLSSMALLMALRRMGVEATVHGFRSGFRDWAAERTSFPREVCEQALAHTIKDKAEAAYRRGDLLDKRRELMETWAAFVTTTGADVVTLRAGASA